MQAMIQHESCDRSHIDVLTAWHDDGLTVPAHPPSPHDAEIHRCLYLTMTVMFLPDKTWDRASNPHSKYRMRFFEPRQFIAYRGW